MKRQPPQAIDSKKKMKHFSPNYKKLQNYNKKTNLGYQINKLVI